MTQLVNRVITVVLAALALGPSSPYPGKYLGWVKVGDEGFAQDRANLEKDFISAIRTMEAEYGQQKAARH